MKPLLFAAMLVAAAAEAQDYLVRVGVDPQSQAVALGQSGVAVLNWFDNWCLVRSDQRELERLSHDFTVTVLDENPADKRYVYVLTEPGFDRRLLAGCGAALTADKDGVLLRVDDECMEALNRLPVELCAVSLREMVLPSARDTIRNPRADFGHVPSDSLIWQLVGRVSQDSLEANLRRLRAFVTRYASTESCRTAVAWVRERLAGYGCDSTFLDTFSGSYAPNVIGVRTGTLSPRRIFVISGHVDNTSEIPQTRAPGSDDNASGTGLVLELGRVFADMDFESTVWLIGFSAEEQGLVGSDSFVYACRQRGDSIIVAMNFDMISYGRDDSATVVWTTSLPQTESLAHFFLAQADTFTDLKAKDTVITTAASDHYSFWKYGYLAIRGRYHDRTPMYHTLGDTIGPFHYANCGTNNLPLYAEVVKATVATLAKWAGASPRTGVEEGPKPRASRLTLTVYPNPFRASATISFSNSSLMTHRSLLSVYDASGRLVRQSPVSRRQSAIVLDQRPLRPGVYLFRLTGNGLAATAKAILAD